MIINKKDKDNTLLFSTTNQTPDVITERPQSNESIFGKIISINLDDNSFSIYSKGHRNIQGLYSDYNVKFLPETQFINLDIYNKKFFFSELFEVSHAEKKILGGYKNRFKSFFIDEYQDKIIITD